jgi:hypothetical protein
MTEDSDQNRASVVLDKSIYYVFLSL